MKPYALAALATLGLAACNDLAMMMPATAAAPVSTAPAVPIATRAAAEPYLGRTLQAGNGSIVISADGTFAGQFGPNAVAGVWEFRDGFWCRTLTAGPPAAMAMRSDCQVWEVAGQEVRFTTQEGAGNTTSYVLG